MKPPGAWSARVHAFTFPQRLRLLRLPLPLLSGLRLYLLCTPPGWAAGQSAEPWPTPRPMSEG